MDCGKNYIVAIVQGDVWLAGLFGDDWSANMKRIDLELGGDDDKTIPIATQVSILNAKEFRVLMSNGELLSIEYSQPIRIVDDYVVDMAGSAYLTEEGEVIIDNEVVAERVDKIFGRKDDCIMVRGNRAFTLNSKSPIIVSEKEIHYVVRGTTELLYVDVEGRLFLNGIQLMGTHTMYGVEKALPFGDTERVILDRKGVIHFMGLKSNRSLQLNEKENSNVLEAPFVAEDIGVFKGIIMAVDQSGRLWSITTLNPERVGWQPITEVNRYYYPKDPYPVIFA
jgi:hypothetical protein